MIDFTTRLVGRFADAQDTSYVVPACTLSLSISGLRRLRVRGEDLSEPGPLLALRACGHVATFAYGPDRENWVILGETTAVRMGPDDGCEIRHGDDWIAVPPIVRLAPEQVPPYLAEFLRLADAFKDPVPASQLRLELGLAALLRPFLDRGERASAAPAARLKRLIEEDERCRESLARLSRRCGLHPDHLRECFRAAYGLTPQAFRNRCRLATAMGLIGGSALGVGEIGQRIGFAHVSHFSGFFRAESGMSPREAIKRYRHG